jgi:predicted porin
MKKSFWMVAAFGTTTAALAQSSVTLSGTVDVYANRAVGSIASRNSVASSGNHSSKLILRATEDLGDGLKAGFWLEAGLNADTGLGTASNANNQPSGASPAPAGTQGLTFNRRSNVSLSGRFGELQLGRNWSPTYDAFTGRFDVFGVGSGIALNYIASINPNHVRVSNGVAYITPRIFGVSANIQHWLGENPGNAANSKDGTGQGIRLNIDHGRFGAVVAWARTQFLAGDAIYRNAAATYDFGAVRLTANITHDQQGSVRQRGALLGLLMPVGLGEYKATFSTFRNNAPRQPEGKKFVIGYAHNLSKRTAAYVTLARIENSNGAAHAIMGATTAPDRPSTGFDVGVRHNF